MRMTSAAAQSGSAPRVRAVPCVVAAAQGQLGHGAREAEAGERVHAPSAQACALGEIAHRGGEVGISDRLERRGAISLPSGRAAT